MGVTKESMTAMGTKEACARERVTTREDTAAPMTSTIAAPTTALHMAKEDTTDPRTTIGARERAKAGVSTEARDNELWREFPYKSNSHRVDNVAFTLGSVMAPSTFVLAWPNR